MFVIGIITFHLTNSNKIDPYLLPTFLLIYLHVTSSEINDSNSLFSVPNLPDFPNHPTDYSFPRQEFGKRKITSRDSGLSSENAYTMAM